MNFLESYWSLLYNVYESTINLSYDWYVYPEMTG